jgi:hypothetical protein
MFLRFTKKFSRPKLGFIIALLMLFTPALVATTVESAAQRNKAKPAPTPKKKATPDRKTQAKTKPTPKPDSKSKSKTAAKNTKETAAKNKTADRRADKRKEKNAPSKNDRRTSDRNKNSKTADRKNSKQNLAANNKIPSKNARNDRSAKNNERNKNAASKNNKSTTADKNKTRLTSSKNAKPTVSKTTPKRPVETKSKTDNPTKNAVKPVADPVPDATLKTTAALPEIIVTTFSVPVRSQASTTAPLLSNVKLGSVLRVAEKKSDWYKVQYWADGKNTTGWIPATAVNDLNASGRSEVYRQIVERNYKPQMDFDTAAEFYEFTSKVGGELDGSDKSGEIELKRLLALRSALKTIPADRRETAPYKDFLKAQEKEIVFNEPAGEWLVVSNEFWNLHSKYKKTTVSETIAWEAANNPLPGECEGYVNCYLFDMRMRFGEYLNLHPNGSRAAEALKNMTDYFSPIVSDAAQKTVYNGPTDVTDRAEFNNLIAELRTIIARLQFVEKEKTLQQLRTIAEAYR